MKYLFGLLIFLLVACKKENTISSVPNDNSSIADSSLKDFLYIPIKDAKWVSKFYGSYLTDPNTRKEYYDEKLRFDVTIETTGTDTMIANKHYYIYKGRLLTTKSNDPTYSYTMKGYVYMREDTINKKVFTIEKWSNSTYREFTLANYNYNVGDAHNGAIILKIDSIVMASQYMKRWLLSANKSLQGKGFGSSTGMLNNGCPTGNAPTYVYTRFFYKNDSVTIY